MAQPLIESLAERDGRDRPGAGVALRRHADGQRRGAAAGARRRGRRAGLGSRRHPSGVELRPSTARLALAEDFAIARGSRTTQEVVRVELEHDGLVGRGEAAPIYYRGETVRSALAFLRDEAPARAAAGDDPFALEAIGAGRRCDGAEAAARAALDARPARLGRAAARRARSGGCSGSSPPPRPPRTRSASTALEGTRDRARRARGFAALKVKVGGAEDLERLEAVREESPVPIARGRQRGLDARVGARAAARAGGARGRADRAAVPRRRPRQLPRAARARSRGRRSSSTRAATTCGTWRPWPATRTRSTSSWRSQAACARRCA